MKSRAALKRVSECLRRWFQSEPEQEEKGGEPLSSERGFDWYDRGSWAAPGPLEPAPLNEGRPQKKDAPAAPGGRGGRRRDVPGVSGGRGGRDAVNGRGSDPRDPGGSGGSRRGAPAGAVGVSRVRGVSGNCSAAARGRERMRMGLLKLVITALVSVATLSLAGGRFPDTAPNGEGASKGRPPAGRQRSMRERLRSAGLAVLSFAVVLTLIGGLDGSDREVEALSTQGAESASTQGSPGGAAGALNSNANSFGAQGNFADLPPLPEGFEAAGLTAAAAGGVQGSSSAGSPASSTRSCPAGYYLYFGVGGVLCAKRISQAAAWGCPTGSTQFSLGIAPTWGCRKDLGTASTSYSCTAGTLVWRTVSS